MSNFIRNIKKYSPDYTRNDLEGWSVILVVAAGFGASTFGDSWLKMSGLFVNGVLGAHLFACAIKFLLTHKNFRLNQSSKTGSAI